MRIYTQPRSIFFRQGWILTLAFILFAQGCGSGYNFPTGPVAGGGGDGEVKANAVAPPAAPARPKADFEEANDVFPKGPANQAANQAADKVDSLPPPLPPPAELSKWDEHDFYVARVTGDPRFLEAVEERIRTPRHTVEEAEQLASYLKPQTLDKSEFTFTPNKPGVRPPATKAADLIRVVTAALGANGTDTAREILGRILSGEITVEDRQAGIDGSLAALLMLASPESEQLVLKLLLAPPRLFPSDQDRSTADPLQKSLLAALRVNAAAGLRARLAKMIVADSATAEQRKLVLPILLDPNPLNLEAQTIIYQSPALDASTLAALEKQLSKLSSEALRTMLEFPEQPPLSSEAKPLSSASLSLSPAMLDWPRRVGELLWSPSFAGLLDLQHHALAKMADRPAALALAATIPNQAMRLNLRRTLSRHWSEGPQSLQSEGLGGRLLVEPGCLTVLKSAAKANALEKAPKPLNLNTSANSSSNKRQSEHPPKKRLNSSIDSAWLKLREELARDYCRRCRAASVAQLVAERHANGDSPRKIPASDAPLLPPSGSDVEAVYRFNWPGEHAAHPPQPADDALRFYYLRIGLRSKLNRMLSYYRRQMNLCLEHSLSDGIWLEGLTETAAGDRARSTDVLIAHAQSGSEVSPNTEQELTVEILYIETHQSHD